MYCINHTETKKKQYVNDFSLKRKIINFSMVVTLEIELKFLFSNHCALYLSVSVEKKSDPTAINM
jgi:negative regulator of genetic competence, sporulation and motility